MRSFAFYAFGEVQIKRICDCVQIGNFQFKHNQAAAANQQQHTHTYIHTPHTSHTHLAHKVSYALHKVSQARLGAASTTSSASSSTSSSSSASASLPHLLCVCVWCLCVCTTFIADRRVHRRLQFCRRRLQLRRVAVIINATKTKAHIDNTCSRGEEG